MRVIPETIDILDLTGRSFSSPRKIGWLAEFAQAHVNKPIDFWLDVIFENESEFKLFECNSKVLVYRSNGPDRYIQDDYSNQKLFHKIS